MGERRWLLLIHQISPKPSYFRVKIWRRLQRLGAVAVKNSVYVLPDSDQSQEDFQWLVQEIVEGGGEASICEARFTDGLSDEQLETLFQTAREADYAQILDEARLLHEIASSMVSDDERRSRIISDFNRLQRRLGDVMAIDFFGAPGREAVDGLMAGLGRNLGRKRTGMQQTENTSQEGEWSGCVWVTRKGVQVDRMASAWFIQRFIDEQAQFKFVQAKGHEPQPGEVRFDMFEAEFTHEGDHCTFEVLIKRFVPDDASLLAIAEIVHDIDLKDSKFNRPETAGIAMLLSGVASVHSTDEARLQRSALIFDDLYAMKNTPVMIGR